MVAKLGAKAASRFEAISKVVSAISTVRRSSRPEATMSAGPAKAASTPGMVIIRPAVPSDTFRPRAMSVKRPMGMNSVETMAKVPTAIEPTASQAERAVLAGSGARSSMQGLLLGEFIMGRSPGPRRQAHTDTLLRKASQCPGGQARHQGPAGSSQFPGGEQSTLLPFPTFPRYAVREAPARAHRQ